jgi:hypothetical protein
MVKLLKFTLLAVAILQFASCNSSRYTKMHEEIKNDPKINELKEQGLLLEMKVVEEIDVNEVDLKFTITESNQQAHALYIEVQYGGGCVEPHIFELISTTEINKEGVADVWLLHKTHDDLCKALLKKKLYFDVSDITALKTKKLKYIRINNEHLLKLDR